MTEALEKRVRRALQINMHPFDAPHVVHTLAHQLKIWAGQVDRILITLDTRLANAGRYRASRYEEAKAQIISVLEAAQQQYPQLVIDPVSYDAQTREKIGAAFFSTSPEWPDRAFDGGPFYVYFHGLLRANADYVFHIDSDMLFGGGSATWMDDAIGLLQDTPDVLCVGPFPGPPREKGGLDESLHVHFPGSSGFAQPQKFDADAPAYRFATVSTRVFMIDMRRFAQRIGALDLVRPDPGRRLRAHLFREAPLSMPAEEVLSANMVARGLSRIDYLGTGAGMFSLHPPYRSPEFYAQLPALISRIERGDIPDGQRGDFDINGAMIDWSSALAAKRPTARYRKALSQLLAVQMARFKGA